MSHVIIVGAGPAGASLAFVMAKRGIHVTLLERQQYFAREFRGEILMPSGIDALEQMGIGEILSAAPNHLLTEVEVYLNGKSVFTQSLTQGAAEDNGFLAVSQAALLESLVAESGTCPSFRFERDATVKGLLVEEERVVGVRAILNGTEQDIRADLVIGADGRSSAVRRHAEISARSISPPMDIVWCKLPCPEGWNGVRAFASSGHLLIAYHTWDGSLQMGWVILKGTFGELKSRGIEQWVEEMANHVSPDLAAHLRDNLDVIRKPFLLSAASQCAEKWSKPGVLLIGDAAHTMSPVGGQGVNIALRDAIVTANHLVPLMTQSKVNPDELTAAMIEIEKERMVEVGQIQALQAQPPKLLLNRAWWGEPLRRIVGAVMIRPGPRHRAAGRVSVFLHGVTDVKLEV